MYFNDRIALGNVLADNLRDLTDTNAVLLCLTPSSMMTVVAMAARLRAWIFPLFYELIKNPAVPNMTLGAVLPNGDFVRFPDVTDREFAAIEQRYAEQFNAEKQAGTQRLAQTISQYNGATDVSLLHNRVIVLVGDVLYSTFELEVAKMILRQAKPARVLGVAGNATIDVSQQFHLSTDQSQVLDIMPSLVLTGDHYFENQDNYTQREKQILASNIAQYWT